MSTNTSRCNSSRWNTCFSWIFLCVKLCFYLLFQLDWRSRILNQGSRSNTILKQKKLSWEVASSPSSTGVQHFVTELILPPGCRSAYAEIWRRQNCRRSSKDCWEPWRCRSRCQSTGNAALEAVGFDRRMIHDTAQIINNVKYNL